MKNEWDINNEIEQETVKAVLVGLETDATENFDHIMDEMVSLIEACDMEVVGTVTQHLEHPQAGTYLGSGKIDELCEIAKGVEANYCIFADNLSPAQQKNIQNLVDVPVWDRTTLILEIFSKRAKTKEARLQVESAYLQYMLPRLSGMWQHLGRQGGGGGSRANKGIGETQLELDRRQIKQRIAELRRELDTITKTREVQRQGREKGGVPRVALVGYTNAGKSTIMNKLLSLNEAPEEKAVFQKDMLFATLDTSIRRIEIEGNKDFLLSDTVGFLENLPHGLVKAFRSTLEEAANSDLLLIILDASDPFCKEHKKVTEDTLKELSADKIPKIYVMNKADLIEDCDFTIPKINGDEIWMSAENGQGIPELISMIISKAYSQNKIADVLIPYDMGKLVNRLHEKATILHEEYVAEGILIKADCPLQIYGEVEKYCVNGDK